MARGMRQKPHYVYDSPRQSQSLPWMALGMVPSHSTATVRHARLSHRPRWRLGSLRSQGLCRPQEQ